MTFSLGLFYTKDMKEERKVPIKKTSKNEREWAVLLGLVDYYIRTAKPVGSNTLKETEFQDLSSATIRNYFANLERDGYLVQQHISGGRIPTSRAYRAYADIYRQETPFSAQWLEALQVLSQEETQEVASLLLRSIDLLSDLTNTAVFLSAPRFDHDYITDIRVVSLDTRRCVFILVTDFGLIRTEVLYLEKKLTTLTAKKMEQYFHWRLTGVDKPEHMESEEEGLGQKIYNELMMRFLVNYTNYREEDVFRTGFAKMLAYPELQIPDVLAQSLALFENTTNMRLLLRECAKMQQSRCWIGEELQTFSLDAPGCAVMAIPYRINQQVVGAVGLLGPLRIPYRELFGALQCFSDCLTATLTHSLYKHKITYRQPQEKASPALIQSPTLLLEVNPQRSKS